MIINTINGTIVLTITYAAAPDDGMALFKILDGLLSLDCIIKIIFDDALMTAGFLNTAIGQLYSKFGSEFLNDHLSIDLPIEDHYMLGEVIHNAKEFFARKKGGAIGT